MMFSSEDKINEWKHTYDNFLNTLG